MFRKLYVTFWNKGDFKAALQEWREDYGDIVGIKLGNELAVVLSNYNVVVTWVTRPILDRILDYSKSLIIRGIWTLDFSIKTTNAVLSDQQIVVVLK